MPSSGALARIGSTSPFFFFFVRVAVVIVVFVVVAVALARRPVTIPRKYSRGRIRFFAQGYYQVFPPFFRFGRGSWRTQESLDLSIRPKSTRRVSPTPFDLTALPRPRCYLCTPFQFQFRTAAPIFFPLSDRG